LKIVVKADVRAAAFNAERRLLLVRQRLMAVARYQAAASMLDVCECPEAVVLQFEDLFSAREWTCLENNGQWLADWKHQA
jgi:hypothetical protein